MLSADLAVLRRCARVSPYFPPASSTVYAIDDHVESLNVNDQSLEPSGDLFAKADGRTEATMSLGIWTQDHVSMKYHSFPQLSVIYSHVAGIEQDQLTIQEEDVRGVV